MLAVTLYLQGGFRFRVVARTLSILGKAFPCLPSSPEHSTVRLWVHRLGLYRLKSAKLGSRWAMICDHTATFGGLKMFVICGVDLNVLDRRVETGEGDFSPTHGDVTPLAIVPMSNSNGELLFELYLKCIEKHGHPESLVSDGGSDIQKSVRLLNESQQALKGKSTLPIYDVSHRIARIIQAALNSSEHWQGLEEFVKEARRYTKYKARHLSPPSLNHGPDRWMNLSGIIRWYTSMIERVKSKGKRMALPRFGVTERIVEVGRATYRKSGRLFKSLIPICGREHPDEATYKKALKEKCPDMPKGMESYLDERKDLNETYLEEVMRGWEKHEEIHGEVTAMLDFTNTVQKKIKLEGLSEESVWSCREIYREGNLEGVGETVGKLVMDMLEEMAQKLEEGQRVIATSDVLESLNGKWKMLISGSPTPALGSNALLMPALMGKLGPDEIKEALETVSVKDVGDWQKATFGVTYHQEKRARCSEDTS